MTRLVFSVVPERRRRLTQRTLPIAGMAAFALVAGLLVGSLADSGKEKTARAFGSAWQRGDWGRMHGLLTPAAREQWSAADLRRAYRKAAATATQTRVIAAKPAGEREGRIRLPVSVRTRIFGIVRGEVLLPVEDGGVDWAPHLVFPGLDPGVPLLRRSEPPRRAKIVSRDGQVLAEGPADARSSPAGALAGSIAGRVAPQENANGRAALYARGFPRDWPVGQTGLERAFEQRLAGRPGGELRAGVRLLGQSRPKPGAKVRSTIDSRLQSAAATALGDRLGGVAALDAGTGEVRALAGIAFSAPQPPGSTFKLVTTTAALNARAVKLSTPFPVQTHATIDGVELENANGESCGGSFEASFAHSCNSVFAPLGVKVGAEPLVAAARRYGFNARPSLPGEVPSTLPAAARIRSDLELGSTAIGQGRVLATPLRMASIAQGIGARGVWIEPTLEHGRPPRRHRATTPHVARTLQRLMVDVVAYGTGTSAAIPGIKVAGKTGTAELEDTRGPNAQDKQPTDQSNTDAWFTAYAPVGRPRIAVAVLLVKAGAGGETAAPVARAVIQAALQ
ncbi:MAG: penicillin-binding transpeptidase domain-containing protein [Thermoleophilaceae bacterium]